MKKAIAAAAVIIGAWSLLFFVGRDRRQATPIESLSEKRFRGGPLREVEAMIAAWPQPAGRAARRMIEKYGPPDEATGRKLVWNDNGPWKRTIIRRDAGPHVLEQVAQLRIPSDRFGLLRSLEGSVGAERGKEEISAKSDSEPLNFLAINLAEEVISGKRDVEQARRFYARTARLALAGKSSTYTESLLFSQEKAK